MYLRIEDPYPFALGLIIPSITVRTADRDWKVVPSKEKPEIAFKIVRIEDFSVFMERDLGEVSIDEIIDLATIMKKPDFLKVREDRIYQHIRTIFDEIYKHDNQPQEESKIQQDSSIIVTEMGGR